MAVKTLVVKLSRQVAHHYGKSAAIIMSRIMWSILCHKNNPEDHHKYFRDGRFWMKNTFAEFAKSLDGVLGERQIKRVVAMLEEDGILISKKFNASKSDHTKWYAIDPQKWNDLHQGTDFIDRDIMTSFDKDIMSQSSSVKSQSKSHITPTVASVDKSEDRRQDIEREEERGVEALKEFEKEFREITPAEKRLFIKNLKANHNLSSSELVRRVQVLAKDPILKASTSSPNRIFHFGDAMKFARNARAELKAITKSSKSQILGQFSAGNWAMQVLNSKVAGRCDFATQGELLDCMAMISFGRDWNELTQNVAQDAAEVNPYLSPVEEFESTPQRVAGLEF